MSLPSAGSSRRPWHRGGSSRPLVEPGVCRSCGTAPALPDEETCGPCGEAAIARARAGVETWLHMHAERVLDLVRQEQDRTGPA